MQSLKADSSIHNLIQLRPSKSKPMLLIKRSVKAKRATGDKPSVIQAKLIEAENRALYERIEGLEVVGVIDRDYNRLLNKLIDRYRENEDSGKV
jgi:hypothetical protein